MGVQAFDIAFVSTSERFLRLHDFQIVGNAGGKAILRLGKCLLCQIDRTACHSYLLGGGIEIEESSADFVIDASPEIRQLRTRLLKLRVGLEHVTVSSVAREDGNVQPAGDLPGSVRLRR